MKRPALLSILALGLSFSLSAQVKEGVEKAIKDPQRKENAAKAEVLLHDKKIITDTTQRVASKQAPATSKKKKKACGRKSS